MVEKQLREGIIHHLRDIETLVKELESYQSKRVYYLSSGAIDEATQVLKTQGKIQAIKQLRDSLTPTILLPLRDAKHIMDQIQHGDTVEYLRGHEPTYRVFRGI